MDVQGKICHLLRWMIRSCVLYIFDKSAALALNYAILGIVSHFFSTTSGAFYGQALGYIAGKSLYFVLDSRYSYEIRDHFLSRGIRFIGLEILFALLTSLLYTWINSICPGHSFLIWIGIMGIDSLVEYILMRLFVFGKSPLSSRAFFD